MRRAYAADMKLPAPDKLWKYICNIYLELSDVANLDASLDNYELRRQYGFPFSSDSDLEEARIPLQLNTVLVDSIVNIHNEVALEVFDSDILGEINSHSPVHAERHDDFADRNASSLLNQMKWIQKRKIDVSCLIIPRLGDLLSVWDDTLEWTFLNSIKELHIPIVTDIKRFIKHFHSLERLEINDEPNALIEHLPDKVFTQILQKIHENMNRKEDIWPGPHVIKAFHLDSSFHPSSTRGVSLSNLVVCSAVNDLGLTFESSVNTTESNSIIKSISCNFPCLTSLSIRILKCWGIEPQGSLDFKPFQTSALKLNKICIHGIEMVSKKQLNYLIGGSIESLIELDLTEVDQEQGNFHEDDFIPWIWRCKNLSVIRINSLKYSDTLIAMIAEACPRMTSIRLLGTNTVISHSGLVDLTKGCRLIETLDLFCNGLSDSFESVKLIADSYRETLVYLAGCFPEDLNAEIMHQYFDRCRKKVLVMNYNSAPSETCHATFYGLINAEAL